MKLGYKNIKQFRIVSIIVLLLYSSAFVLVEYYLKNPLIFYVMSVVFLIYVIGNVFLVRTKKELLDEPFRISILHRKFYIYNLDKLLLTVMFIIFLIDEKSTNSFIFYSVCSLLGLSLFVMKKEKLD